MRKLLQYFWLRIRRPYVGYNMTVGDWVVEIKHPEHWGTGKVSKDEKTKHAFITFPI